MLNYRNSSFIFSILLFLLLPQITSCTAKKNKKEIEQQKGETTPSFSPKKIKEPLISINIIDRNSLSETITSKERLKLLEKTNFTSSQPYQKVLRNFAKNKEGQNISIITSYYDNGTLKQYLEIVNGRAFGTYCEWYATGVKKLQAKLIAGPPDIDEKSQLAWSFDETSYAWNEEGKLLTKIPYEKGQINGQSIYYHPNGQIAKLVPYKNGEINGTIEAFSEDGSLVEQTTYENGLQHGESLGLWPNKKVCWKECFENDLLKEGVYYTPDGVCISSIKDGTGKRCFFDATTPSEFCEYKNGIPEGEVVVLLPNKTPYCRYFIKDGKKHGEETIYYPPKPFEKEKNLQPRQKMTIEWYAGKIHGIVKTWYEDGIQESQREMSQNTKQGHLTAWYRDGSLMLIEEYEKDVLVRGSYMKKGESTPVSFIQNGKGVATLFDQEGNFNRKVRYQDGQPIEE